MVAPKRSVRRMVHDGRFMYLVELTCGEEPCEVTVVVVSDLEQVDALVCDECEYCLHVLAISAVEYTDVVQRPALLLAA